MRPILQLAIFITTTVSAQVEPVEYKKAITEDSIKLSVRNLLPAPLQYNIQCDTIDYEGDFLIPFDSSFVEVMKTENFLLNDSIDLSDYIEVNAKIGDSNAKHNDDFEYMLPFAKGERYELIQGFNGKFSHASKHSRFALDFKMPEGSRVHAARAGIICYFQEGFDEGGRNREKYINKSNRIMILHDDGTIGYYNHLLKEGVLVELGQVVKTGELIGRSGNTGFTTTPHLHFVVRSGPKSVPFKMIGLKKQKKGRKYGH